MERIYPKLKVILDQKELLAIEEQGTHVTDIDGDLVTPLVNGGECAYVIFDEKGITKCGIEKKHYEDGVVDWQNPFLVTFIRLE